MPAEKLTDARLRGLKFEDDEIVDIKSGTSARADKTGVVSFSYRYRFGGSRRRLALGRYPEVSLADARAATSRVRDQIRNGIDPQQERQNRRAASTTLTIEALAGLFLERYSKRVKTSWREDARYLRANVLPAWGTRNAASIKRQDATRLLFDVAAHAPVAANRLRAMLSKLFGWATDSGLLDENPMLGVKKPHREGRGKTRILSDPEIRVIWGTLEAADIALGTIAALKVLLLTGQRPGEVAGMAADELHHLDDAAAALWSIPAHRMKARVVHLVPLPPLALQIVLAELARQPSPEFVFTSRSGAQLPRASLARIFADLIDGLAADPTDADVIARLKADRPTPHDMRRTVATNLSRFGIPREDRLAVLAHAHGDVHGQVYDQFDRLPQKRIALETWERHVRQVIVGQPTSGAKAKVIAIRQAVSP